MRNQTTRERVIEILKNSNRPLSAEEIARQLDSDIDPREIYEHLEHVAKSLITRSKGREILVMEPPICNRCGFVFKDINKPKKPSRCPRCRSEWISPPRFTIITRD